jgi:hypothetical protein
MKKCVFLLMMFASGTTLMQAQLQTPAPSPASKIEQKIGLTDVTVEYSRPSKKGRVIFGDVVPFDEVWRTGANAATKITFSEDVNFGGAEVKKGSYAMLTKPGKKTWSVMLYPHNSTSYGSYLESDVKPITVSTEAIEMPKETDVETFMIGFDGLGNHGGTMFLLWERTFVPVEIKVNTDKTVEASMTIVMGGPTAGDYFSAASYYYNEKKDLNKALEWINTSIAKGNEKYWVLRTKSLIQAELGDKKGAIETATKSLELAKKDDDAAYVRMNEASIAEWKKSK